MSRKHTLFSTVFPTVQSIGFWIQTNKKEKNKEEKKKYSHLVRMVKTEIQVEKSFKKNLKDEDNKWEYLFIKIFKVKIKRIYQNHTISVCTSFRPVMHFLCNITYTFPLHPWVFFSMFLLWYNFNLNEMLWIWSKELLYTLYQEYHYCLHFTPYTLSFTIPLSYFSGRIIWEWGTDAS